MTFCPNAFLMPLNSMMIGSAFGSAMPPNSSIGRHDEAGAGSAPRFRGSAGFWRCRSGGRLQNLFEPQLDGLTAAVAVRPELADHGDFAAQGAGALAHGDAESAHAFAALELELELEVPTGDLTSGEHRALEGELRRFIA